MKIFYKYIILSFIIQLSCGKKEENKDEKITVHITRNDSVVKIAETNIRSKYKILGKNKDVNLIVKNEKTLNQVSGTFSTGFYEKSKPLNKMISFLTDENIGLPDLSNEISILKYSLTDEYKTMLNSNSSVISQVIENYSEIYGSNNGKHLSFIFLNQEKDTLGYQHTFFVNINNKLCTFYYLTETLDDYYELKDAFEEFTVSI